MILVHSIVAMHRIVPQEVADAFRGAFAKGIYFNTRIRDQFPHREITIEADETHS